MIFLDHSCNTPNCCYLVGDMHVIAFTYFGLQAMILANTGIGGEMYNGSSKPFFLATASTCAHGE